MPNIVRSADQWVVEHSGIRALTCHQQLACNAVVAVLQILYGARRATRELQSSSRCGKVRLPSERACAYTSIIHLDGLFDPYCMVLCTGAAR